MELQRLRDLHQDTLSRLREATEIKYRLEGTESILRALIAEWEKDLQAQIVEAQGQLDEPAE